MNLNHVGPLPARPAERRRLFRAALTLGCVSVLLLGCNRQTAVDAGAGQRSKKAAVPVLVAETTQKAIPVEIRAIGNVMAYTKVTIRSRITGHLMQVHFREGQEVNQGDLLFTIDPRPVGASLRQAEATLARDEAQLEQARIEFDRSQSLLDASLVSKEDYDRVRATFQAMKSTVLAGRATVSNAMLNVEFTSIHSPISGRTGNLLINEGNVVKAEDDQLVTINQVHPIYVSFAVPEGHLPSIKQEMSKGTLHVEASYAGLEGPVPRGELTFVDNNVDTTTGTIQLKATFTNEDNALWPGQFVQVTLTLNTQPRALVVPSQAVQTGLNGPFVFVVKADKSVEVRPVVPGLSHGTETVIDRGLTAGETVVIDGQLRLVPGATVNVRTDLAPIKTTGQEKQTAS